MNKLTNLVFLGCCFILFCCNCGSSHSQVLYITSLPMVSIQHATHKIYGSGTKQKIVLKCSCCSTVCFHSVKLCELESLFYTNEINKQVQKSFNAKACYLMWKALFSCWQCMISFQYPFLPSQFQMKDLETLLQLIKYISFKK